MVGQLHITLTNGEHLLGHPIGFPDTAPDGSNVHHVYVYGEGMRDIPADFLAQAEMITEPDDAA